MIILPNVGAIISDIDVRGVLVRLLCCFLYVLFFVFLVNCFIEGRKMTIIQVALCNVPTEVKHNNNKIFPRFINSVQSLYMAIFGVHINGPCYKQIVL